MIARAAIALAALAGLVRAQPAPVQASIWVDVSTDEPEVEKRYTPELIQELQSAKADALLLYTEFTARAGTDLKNFFKNMSGLGNETTNAVDWRLDNVPDHCRSAFEKRLKRIEYDAHRAATFSGENHHKFFLGHMIVFRMHLNKSEEYIKKCDNVIKTCGIKCETTPKITRWRKLAAEEIHRVRGDIQYTRRSYRDLLAHARRRLNALRRQATAKVLDAVGELEVCAKG